MLSRETRQEMAAQGIRVVASVNLQEALLALFGERQAEDGHESRS